MIWHDYHWLYVISHHDSGQGTPITLTTAPSSNGARSLDIGTISRNLTPTCAVDVIGFQVVSSIGSVAQKKTNRFPHKTVVLRSPVGRISEKRYPLATKHSNGNHRGRKSCALEPAPSLNQPKKWALSTWCMRALQLYNGHASSSCIKKNSSKSRSWYVLLPFGPRSPKEIGCFSHVEPAPLRLLKMTAKEPEILLPRHPTQHSLSSIPFEYIYEYVMRQEVMWSKIYLHST